MPVFLKTKFDIMLENRNLLYVNSEGF